MAKSTSQPTAKANDESSALRSLMDRFDDLPPEIREALATAIAPSDQMIEVLCTMHQSGFPLSDLLRVIAASNANSSR
jgi:hypothetical protein